MPQKPKHKKAYDEATRMTIEEENYWRGYIDAKVEDLGKARIMAVSAEKKAEYRDQLMREKGLK